MARFNHAVTLAFEVITDHEQGEDLTYEQFRQAVIDRVDGLRYREEYKDAVLPPYDTYEIETAEEVTE